MPLWILDEPFTALDVAATELLKQKIEHFANAGGMVVMTTHQEVLINAPNFVPLRNTWPASLLKKVRGRPTSARTDR